ncbi:MAG TPA: serine/threonine-protein kinase [Solirubrobacteraceae bacterium]
MAGTPLEAGTELAGYRIDRFVSQGGMGAVYEATQLSLDRRVALKLISDRIGSDERFRERFRREARSAAAIDHPNILPVYEAVELEDGLLFLAMRFVDGPDLNSFLRECGPLSPEQAVTILGQIGDALDAAHRHGLVHRDVKPANVMLEPREHGWRAYLTDFGLAKPRDDRDLHTVTGELLGTVDYMAPEQINGEPLDGRADVYAFGCMVYRCLTGELPYKRDSRMATLMAHANAPVPVPSHAVHGIPPALDVVVKRAMEKDRSKRAGSTGALMRWAAEQLANPPALAPAMTDESPTEDGGPREATTVVAPPRTPPIAAAPAPAPVASFFTRALFHVAVYAPLWAGAYLVGRKL